MGYMHIENLYANQDILMYKECYAMEKIHGTSAHISYKNGVVSFYSGGVKYENFVGLFDVEALTRKLIGLVDPDTSVHIYGEAYGGSCQRMERTYGDKLRFAGFEVKIGDTWLNVPKAEQFCLSLGLEFVYYVRIPATLDAIDAERDAPSVQAIRNGITEPRIREGVVLRPLEEVIKNNGERIISKHKRDEFRETATPRNVGDRLKKLEDAKAIVAEWVTEERLNHILSRGEVELKTQHIGPIIALMIEDVKREGANEIEWTPTVKSAIGRETALMVKRLLIQEVKKDGQR